MVRLTIPRNSRPIDMSEKENRNFAYVVGTVIALLSLAKIHFADGGSLAIVLLCSGVVLVLLGFLRPSWLSPLNRAWMHLAAILAWFNTRLILALVYVLMIVPVALFARSILRRDLIDAGIDGDERNSYWREREEEEDMDPEKLERMF